MSGYRFHPTIEALVPFPHSGIAYALDKRPLWVVASCMAAAARA
jgi:hypothetical protein